MKALDIKDLNKTYANGVCALNNLSLAVDSGEFLGLLGPNGAGKTTLIGILNSLVLKSSGKIFVFNHDIDRAFARAKTCIGTVPQEFNFSVFEKVMDIVINQAGFFGLPYRLACQRAEKYLSMLGLWEKRNHYSKSLSGGMKRRLMIARAMVHEPKLLILDEPTAGVDIHLRRTMWSFLEEVNAMGTTILLTTHYLEEAEQLCQRIAILNQGQIIQDMNKHQLISQLKVESFVMDSAQPINLKMQQALVNTTAPGIAFTDITNDTFQVNISQPASINQVFDLLENHNITIGSMRNKVNRLEELFVKYTEKTQETV